MQSGVITSKLSQAHFYKKHIYSHFETFKLYSII